MYTRINKINKNFVDRVENFITFACNQLGVTNVAELRSLCRKFQYREFHTLDEVKFHLFKKGFIPHYYVWNRYGEQYVHATSTNSKCNIHGEVDTESSNPYRQMILDMAGPDFNATRFEFNAEDIDEVPNPNAQKFYDMPSAVDKKL